MTNTSHWGIRVLIADDSPTMRHYLTSLINEAPGLRVVGEARDGEEALALALELRPDVISMDINMPRMDGLEATRRIMMQRPTPVVVVSSLVERDIELSMQALDAGALAVVEKPPDRRSPIFPEKQRQLIKTLVAMAGVRVIRRGSATGPLNGSTAKKVIETPTVSKGSTRPEIIAIGASAGGPSALSKLLRELPTNLPVPVVIVQHIPNEFVGGLARWLKKITPLHVMVATDGLALEPGVVNLSPGAVHLTVFRKGRQLTAQLIREKGRHRYQPSVDALFESVAVSCGAAAVGVVLTGMGDDGASGLLAMRRVGAFTFAQDEQSSTVFGMPAAAVERGAVQTVLSLANLPSAILKLL